MKKKSFYAAQIINMSGSCAVIIGSHRWTNQIGIEWSVLNCLELHTWVSAPPALRQLDAQLAV